jgi:ComF family protein
LQRPPEFKATLSPLIYAFPVDRLIQDLKYGHRLEIAPVLAEIWLEDIGPPTLPDALVAMPLHPARLKQRGFNQAQELGRHLARQISVPLLHDACERIRDTPPQADLKLKDRQRNLRGAFAASTKKVTGKRIAIVDDVMTTGSSLDELAKALAKAGAVQVECWVIARALPSTN